MIFDANTASAVQQILNLRTQLIGLADTTREAGDKSKNSLDGIADAAAAAGEGISSAVEMIGGMAISVAGVVEELKTTVDNYMETMEKRAGGLLDKTTTLNSALAASGQGEAAPQIRQQIGELVEKGVDGVVVAPEDATKMFAAISNAVMDKLSPQEKLEATKVGLMGIGAKLDETQATNLGIDYAKLDVFRRPGMGMEKVGDENLQHYAMQLQAAYGASVPDQALRLLSRATNKDEAMKLILAAPHVYDGGRAINSMLTAAEETIPRERVLESERKLLEAHKGNAAAAALPEPVLEQARRDIAAEEKENPRERAEIERAKRTGEDKFTDEDARILRMSHIAPEQRLDAVINDPSLLPAADQLEARNLGKGAAQVPQIPSLQSQIDWWDQNADPETRAAEENRQAEIQQQRVDTIKDVQFAREQAILKSAHADFEKNHPLLQLMQVGALMDWAREFDMFAIDNIGPALQASEQRAADQGTDPSVGSAEDTRGAIEADQAAGMPMLDPGSGKVLNADGTMGPQLGLDGRRPTPQPSLSTIQRLKALFDWMTSTSIMDTGENFLTSSSIADFAKNAPQQAFGPSAPPPPAPPNGPAGNLSSSDQSPQATANQIGAAASGIGYWNGVAWSTTPPTAAQRQEVLQAPPDRASLAAAIGRDLSGNAPHFDQGAGPVNASGLAPMTSVVPGGADNSQGIIAAIERMAAAITRKITEQTAAIQKHKSNPSLANNSAGQQ